jgi:L-asparaginase II
MRRSTARDAETGDSSACSACGIPTHVLELDQVAPADEMTAHAVQVQADPAKFAALRNADCRPYLFGAAPAMMADNIERHPRLTRAERRGLCLGTLAAGI